MKLDRLAPLVPIFLAAGGCQPGGVPSEGARESLSVSAPRSNVFDPGRLAVSDTLLGLRVSSIEVTPSPMDSGGWMGEVRFEGPIDLMVEYRPHYDYPEPPAPRTARIVVDQYRYLFSHTDVYNTARLVRVSP